MPYKPMWELLSENADSMKRNCFAEMSSFRWKFTTGTTLSKDSPSLFLLCHSVLGIEDPCLLLLESLEMLSFIQSFTVFGFPANMGFQSHYELSSLSPSRQCWAKRHKEDRLQSFFAKDEASRAFPVSYLLLSFETRAGKWDLQWQN